jgi:LacI family transcriptional regulator
MASVDRVSLRPGNVLESSALIGEITSGYSSQVSDARRVDALSKAITLGDIARRAGVSQPTASRVLNGSARRVKEEYRQRVLAAADELGYTPNLSAQTVARGTSRSIALVMSGISDPYFSEMAAAILHQAQRIGLVASIAVTERSVTRELELVREARGHQPRAIILAGTGYVDPPSYGALVDELRRYEAAGGRVVLISRSDLPFEQVAFDNHEGARKLGRRLAEIGYRKCLIVGSGTPLLAMRQRVEGFIAGLAELEIEQRPDWVFYPEFSREESRKLIENMDESVLNDAELVFAVTDDLALGVLAGIRARGLRVPDDIAVAGFDDIKTLQDIVPPLTTVHVPLDEVAEDAVYRATTPKPELVRRTIPTYPIVRDSTPPMGGHGRA